jgi:hypothetical protein
VRLSFFLDKSMLAIENRKVGSVDISLFTSRSFLGRAREKFVCENLATTQCSRGRIRFSPLDHRIWTGRANYGLIGVTSWKDCMYSAGIVSPF